MSVSFIVFIVVAVVVVAVAAFCLGAWVSKATKKESPEAQNTTPYEDCLAKNANKFKYGSFTDARDGETYRTVKIGGQVWMAENLRYNAEDSYPAGNDESNVKKFGRLYKWTTALGIPAIFSEQSPANDMEMYRKLKADKANPCHLGSTIPGTVETVLVKEGDHVTVNQPLMIVEAMKMETTFVSNVNGTIDKIYAAPGERVNTEDLLISFVLDEEEEK